MKYLKFIFVLSFSVFILSFSVSAKTYDQSFSCDIPLSARNWIEADLEGLGKCTLIFCECFNDLDLCFTSDDLGFRTPFVIDVGFNHLVDPSYICLGIIIDSSLNQYQIIFNDGFLYIDGETPLSFNEIYDTNMNIVDYFGDWSSDNFKYSQTDIILIFIALVLFAILLFYILRSAFRA